MSKKYRVVVEHSYLLEDYIEADSIEQAWDLARELDGGGFKEVDGSSLWHVEDVHEEDD